MKRLRQKKGFSLIEVILAIVILAVSFMGITYVLSNTTIFNIDLDISTTAIFLARERMAGTKAKPFADIIDVSTTSFPGEFSDYSYEVEVDYVNAADLDIPVGGPTDYKRIIVTVICTGWSGNIELYDLKTKLD